jgi:CHAT domain-containing protein/Flp pilus assembly protein TadD
MRFFRFVVIFFLAVIVIIMSFPRSSPCQSDEEMKRLAGQLVQLQEQGRYHEAIPFAVKLLAIYEGRRGPDHPDVARALNDLAELYRNTGRYAEAESLYRRSLAIKEKTLGKDHPGVAISLNNLASLYHMTSRYAEAESLCRHSLAIFEKTLGKDHPDVAISLNNLAKLLETTGRYAEAEPLYRRSLAIKEKTLGKDHPSVAISLNNLAELYRNTGRYAEAEPLYRRSLAIFEKTLGEDHPNVARSLNNLGLLYYTAGRYAEAEPLYRRSLAISERVLGKDHPDVAQSLNNLAALYRNTGRYADAEPLYRRSLTIYEKTLGPDHPDVALSLNNLGFLYDATGRHADAEPLYRRSLAIREKALGPDHPDVALALSNLGIYYGITGKHAEAHVLLNRSVTIQDSVRESTFTLLTEKQKLSYMKTQEGYVYGYLSHTLDYLRDDQAAVIDTFNTWLRWKGSVIEAQGRYLDALTTSDDPKVREKLKQLADVQREIAKLQLSGPVKMAPDEYRGKIAELQKKKESLESELMAMSKDFTVEKKARTADVKALSSIIPKDTVYLDYARIEPYDFQKKVFGKPRYLLFLFTPGDARKVRFTDIGPSEEVDRRISAYLKEMGRAKTEGSLPDEKKLRREASALYGLLIKPVEAFLKDKKHLLVSPDGNLNLIPFEALTTSSGAYLMEGYLISYVGAGRDMVKFAQSSLKGGTSLIFADPDYDLGQKGIEEAKSSSGVRTAHVRAPVSRDAKGMYFDRLPDTKEEANTIEKILKSKLGHEVVNCQNTKALEDILFTTSSPKVLHLATHGYFLTREETRQPLKMQDLSPAGDPLKAPSITIENPMLRSGIVLAGVNTSLKEGRDEGMVTAEKVLGLKLKGTDLVVLSACETGIGDIQSGEGVFGLKRAFILSGAKTLVMSLWSVPSKETMDLMTSFYALLSEGKTKAEALRQAKLAVMKKNPHPFFWGAFTVTGSP